jgi:hypothetical protein
MYELSGTIKLVKDTEVINDKFRKREFVVTEDSSQYPQVVLFELTQDKCELLDQFKAGQKVKVSFNIRGREWVNRQNETRYFVTLNAWRIDAAEGAQHAPDRGAAAPFPTAADAPDEDDDDVLPF